MSYTPPNGDAIEFEFAATHYVAPVGDAIAFEFAPVASSSTMMRRTLTAIGTRIGSRQLHGGH